MAPNIKVGAAKVVEAEQIARVAAVNSTQSWNWSESQHESEPVNSVDSSTWGDGAATSTFMVAVVRCDRLLTLHRSGLVRRANWEYFWNVAQAADFFGTQEPFLDLELEYLADHSRKLFSQDS